MQKTMLITGSSNPIGLETARMLLARHRGDPGRNDPGGQANMTNTPFPTPFPPVVGDSTQSR